MHHYKNQVRFINYSTSIPFDRGLLDDFIAIAKDQWTVTTDPQYDHYYPRSINVFFANRKEFDIKRINELNRTRDDERPYDECAEPNPDLLGFYAPCQSAYTNPVIFVCPEKIMELSLRLNRDGTIHEKVGTIYPTLLIKVILHELAHWLMDGRWRRYCRCRHSASWLTHGFDDPERDDEWYLDILNLGKSHCSYRGLTDRFRKQPWYTVIEESLANAYALKFFKKKQQKRIADAFVSVQPPQYRAGLCWDLSVRDLHATMESWAEVLDDWDLEELIEKSSTTTFLDDLSTSLLRGDKIGTAIDFGNQRDDALRKLGITPWCDRRCKAGEEETA